MNNPPRYPSGTVRSLLPSAHVSEATRSVLQARLAASDRPYQSAFFTNEQFQLLRAICLCLTGSDAQAATIDVARAIDSRLAEGGGDGWRFATFPSDSETWRIALDGIAAESRARFAQPFTDLSSEDQEAVLAAVQSGTIVGEPWDSVAPDQFFGEMMAEVSEAFYCHPLAQEEIGYVGMADLPRWESIGLNGHDEREPRPIGGRDVDV